MSDETEKLLIFNRLHNLMLNCAIVSENTTCNVYPMTGTIGDVKSQVAKLEKILTQIRDFGEGEK